MNPFELILTQPILNVLIIFYQLFLAVHLPWALGFSIIALTVAIRMVLWPLTTAQLKSTQKMAALKPHLDRIKVEHGHDKVRHQQEVSKLYKEHNVNPLAGCLPVVLQLPVFFALYNVLQKIVELNNNDAINAINQKVYPFLSFFHINNIPDTHFLGFDLATKPNQWAKLGGLGFLILLIPVLTAVFQFIQSKMITPAPTVAPAKKQKPAKDKEKQKEGLEDTMAQMQGQMTFLMPAMIAFFSYNFPVGLALYWNTFTIIGIIQQYKIAGAGALNKYLPAKWQK